MFIKRVISIFIFIAVSALAVTDHAVLASEIKSAASIRKELEQSYIEKERELILNSRVDVIDKKIDSVKDYVANSQKLIDWWIAFLSIFLAVVGIAAPYVLTRRLRREYQQQISTAQKAAIECRKILAQIRDDHATVQLVAKEVQERRNALLDPKFVITEAGNNTASEDRSEQDIETSSSSTPADAVFQEGLKAESSERWLDAISAWTMLKLLDPESVTFVRTAWAYRGLAQEQIEKRDFHRAREYLDIAINLIGSNIDGDTKKFPLAAAYIVLGQSKKLMADISENADDKKKLRYDSIEAFSNYRNLSGSDPAYALYMIGVAYIDIAKTSVDDEQSTSIKEAINTLSLSLELNFTQFVAGALLEAHAFAAEHENAKELKNSHGEAVLKISGSLTEHPNTSDYGYVISAIACTAVARLVEDDSLREKLKSAAADLLKKAQEKFPQSDAVTELLNSVLSEENRHSQS